VTIRSAGQDHASHGLRIATPVSFTSRVLRVSVLAAMDDDLPTFAARLADELGEVRLGLLHLHFEVI
jgi:hypothetical protein